MNIARVENRFVVGSEIVGVSVYDFDFDLNFNTTHPYAFEHEEPCILRIGAIGDYRAEYENKLKIGLRLINDPEQHLMASELEHWYPLLEDLTPRSFLFDKLPEVSEIQRLFSWPVFIKGSRQTSKHSAKLSIARDPVEYASIVNEYTKNPILHWQKPVVRQFVELEPIEGNVPNQVRPSKEYRSFWLNGECVGWGRYWYQVPNYESRDIKEGLAIASKAVTRLQVPFIVIDFAKTADGRWIIIECNDAQESGLVGIDARNVWREVVKRFPPSS